MGIKYLWDTNIAIYYLQRQFPPAAEKLMDKTLEELQPALSVITEIELLCWEGASEEELLLINNLISYAVLYNLSDKIKQATVAIRKEYRLKLPDAIIAATAQVNDLTLVTHNISDFKKIRSLKIVDPYQM